MASFFFQLGRLAGQKLRKARWILQSLTGTEADAIQAEFQVGRDLATAIARTIELDTDPIVTGLIQEIGSRLAGRVKNPSRRFAFHVLRSGEVNAFAVPGGFIWVTRPLVELCGRGPDELAFVLGHEMAHVLRKHAMDRLMASSVMDLVLRAAPMGSLMRSQLTGILRELLEQRYSQDQELDADELGVRLARSAGFQPDAAIHMLEQLKRQSGEEPGIGQYFSSHPPFDLRVARIRSARK